MAVEMKLYNAENVRNEIVNEVPFYTVGNATTEEVPIAMAHYTDTYSGLPFEENNGVYVATTCQKYMNDNNIFSSIYIVVLMQTGKIKHKDITILAIIEERL